MNGWSPPACSAPTPTPSGGPCTRSSSLPERSCSAPSLSASLGATFLPKTTSDAGPRPARTSYATASTCRRRARKESMLAEAEALEHLRLATSVAGLDVEELVLPADHDIVVDGMRLHYLDWGCKGPPLLFLHGGCLTAHSWDLVCLALHHEYHCIALDQRGHGDSEWSPTLDYGPEAHVRDIRGLVAKVALTMPVLVGQSMGGLNAITYAAQ